MVQRRLALARVGHLLVLESMAVCSAALVVVGARGALARVMSYACKGILLRSQSYHSIKRKEDTNDLYRKQLETSLWRKGKTKKVSEGLNESGIGSLKWSGKLP
jgi:hypothetical protein